MKTELQNSPLNILLADDDIDDRQLFAKALSEVSIPTHLTTVQDGEQLMKYLSENSENLPDVVFLDLSMPRKTGFECLSEIKENAKFKDIPVIMITISLPHSPDFEKEVISMLSKLGMQDYIKKTNDFAQLKQVIQDALTLVLKKRHSENKNNDEITEKKLPD